MKEPRMNTEPRTDTDEHGWMQRNAVAGGRVFEY